MLPCRCAGGDDAHSSAEDGATRPEMRTCGRSAAARGRGACDVSTDLPSAYPLNVEGDMRL